MEGFIGLPRLGERIRELAEGMSRESVAFKVAEEIVYGKFGRLAEEKAASQAIRTALAILTEGVTAAVYSEGIAKVAAKSNLDGSRYLGIYFAGPIRSAGGTETALTPVVADFVRLLLGMDRYKPTEEEIGRFVEELRLYEREVGRFQYHVSDEELRRVLQHLPVEITGTPSDRIEVSSFRNLPRIETNCLRGGALRVVNDGIIGRAAKVLAVVEDLGIQGWEWLKEIRKIEKGKTSGFMENVPVGRPILSFPSARGGFRLRYGRARNTGLSAVGVHPLTMATLRDFLVGGVQLKFETPSKSGVVLPVDSIETPIVRLNDRSVVRVSQENFDQIGDKIDRILFLGDLLVSFGDFLYNSRNLLPAGYTEEWWREEVQLIIAHRYGGDMEQATREIGPPATSLEDYLRDPFRNRPDVEEAIHLSKALGVPLHPTWTFFWHSISSQNLGELRSWLLLSKVEVRGERITEIKGPIDKSVKGLLEDICVPHKVSESEILLQGAEAHAFAFTLGFHNPKKRTSDAKPILENLSRLCGVTIRSKAPSFIGARVGRPEKAKRREMSPLVQVLFPVGLSGGSQRDLMKACEKDVIQVVIAKRLCSECKTTTFAPICPNCGSPTIWESVCPRCARNLKTTTCPVCRAQAVNFASQSIPLRQMVDKACSDARYTPKRVKGVKGLTNRTKTPETLSKGILRAKHKLSVYKDGTVRFDATNAPLTHFKPSETGISVQKLMELGYRSDYTGKPLVNSEQMCELRVQDIVVPWRSVDYLIRTSKYVDELLEKVYGLPAFYNVNRPEDLIGHLVVGLAPHTCAGILGRVIGFTRLRVCMAHPLWHSAKRRDCDGDEDSIMLALDAFLNFSKEYLPDQIGGIMDSPLFIVHALNPKEVQRQAHELDVSFEYPLAFYEDSLKRAKSREVTDLVEIVKHRLGSEAQLQGFGFTVPTSNVNAGGSESVYKTLTRMTDKLKAQLRLAEEIAAVDARQVAEIVLTTHFLRDISGNLRAFATQSFRCKGCNRRFRRIPLKGKCTECGGELTLTVYRGGIEKYLEDARGLVERYGLSEYYGQRLSLIEQEIVSLFETGQDTKQTSLSKFVKA